MITLRLYKYLRTDVGLMDCVNSLCCLEVVCPNKALRSTLGTQLAKLGAHFVFVCVMTRPSSGAITIFLLGTDRLAELESDSGETRVRLLLGTLSIEETWRVRL